MQNEQLHLHFLLLFVVKKCIVKTLIPQSNKYCSLHFYKYYNTAKPFYVAFA